MRRRAFTHTLACLLGAGLNRSLPMVPFALDLQAHPDLQFRIDAFSVPHASREAFEGAMRRNLDFLQTLPGFLGHVVFEKTGGPTTFDLVTLATWRDRAALEAAGSAMRERNQRLGFDLPAMLAEWGIKAQIGEFQAPSRLQ